MVSGNYSKEPTLQNIRMPSIGKIIRSPIIVDSVLSTYQAFEGSQPTSQESHAHFSHLPYHRQLPSKTLVHQVYRIYIHAGSRTQPWVGESTGF